MNAALRNYAIRGEKAAMPYALGVPRQAPVGMIGGTLSQRSGSSLEFRDHRAYEPGDDLRLVDWNVYLRTERLFVRRADETRVLPVHLFVDASSSMRLDGGPRRRAALQAAAVVAAAALNQSDPVTLTAFGA